MYVNLFRGFNTESGDLGEYILSMKEKDELEKFLLLYNQAFGTNMCLSKNDEITVKSYRKWQKGKIFLTNFTCQRGRTKSLMDLERQ